VNRSVLVRTTAELIPLGIVSYAERALRLRSSRLADHLLLISPVGYSGAGKTGKTGTQLLNFASRFMTLRFVAASLLLVAMLAPLDARAQTLPDGVAAGDTTASSSVLWTRSTALGNVTFQYGVDPAFTIVLGSDVRTVTSATLPVKAPISGLSPGTQYYYRVTDAAGAIGSGQFRTPAAAGQFAGLHFGVSGDWYGSTTTYRSLANAAGSNLDFFVALGDTTYADRTTPAGGAASTLSQYRAKEAEVYDDPNMRLLRASTSIYATIDDHEVINNFSGGAPPATDSRFQNVGSYINETPRYLNGIQAFQEYNPVLATTYGATGDPRTAGKPELYRYQTFGSDAAMFVLDTRSFRDQPITDHGLFGLPETIADAFAPGRTLLGQQQLNDLKHDLSAAQAAGQTWKFVMIPEPIQYVGPLSIEDRYEGYAAERADLLHYIHDQHIQNVVFVSADIHESLVNDLSYQTGVDQPEVRTQAWEITTGATFGPTPGMLSTMTELHDTGLISAAQWSQYQALSPAGKDAFAQNFLDGTFFPALAEFWGYYPANPYGLTDSPYINAKLLQGTWNVGHTWNWTQFDIDPATQKLTVTTYAVNTGTGSPQQPQIFSQFEVAPVPEPASATLAMLAAAALAAVCWLRTVRKRAKQVSDGECSASLILLTAARTPATVALKLFRRVPIWDR
jgi:phosphodiesterase/alkaline phosphatase D-like protein